MVAYANGLSPGFQGAAPDGAFPGDPPDADPLSESYFFLGRLAPYIERLCMRPWTPWQSSLPRTMW